METTRQKVRARNVPPGNGRLLRFHKDRTVSYWSYFEQRWVEHVFHVPAEELELMDEHSRLRLEKRLGI